MQSIKLLNHTGETITIKIHESINKIRIKNGHGIPKRMINCDGYHCPKTDDFLMCLGEFYEQYPEHKFNTKDLSEKDSQDSLLNFLIEEKLPANLKTLNYEITWGKDYLNVGCQTISKQDALKLAEAIQTMWGY